MIILLFSPSIFCYTAGKLNLMNIAVTGSIPSEIGLLLNLGKKKNYACLRNAVSKPNCLWLSHHFHHFTFTVSDLFEVVSPSLTGIIPSELGILTLLGKCIFDKRTFLRGIVALITQEVRILDRYCCVLHFTFAKVSLSLI
jgi:hypothetical protein